jgi:hypothetical protein
VKYGKRSGFTLMPRSGEVSPSEGSEQSNRMLQVVPRVEEGVPLIDLLRKFVNRLDIVRDLADTKVVRFGAGLMEVHGEGGCQLQEPVVVPIDLDERAFGVLNVVKESIEHAPQLLHVNHERARL